MSRLPRAGAVARALLAGSVALLLAACSSAPKQNPAPLEAIQPKMPGRVAWSRALEGGVAYPLYIAVDPGQASFVVAGSAGQVLALDAGDGHELWRADVGGKVSAGVGSDGRFAALVTRDNELVVLDRGRLLWRKPLVSKVETAPLVAGERVFVMGVDRVVNAFDALDGRKLWTLSRPGEPLTLAKGSVLTAVKDTLVAAQGPRLVGVDPLNGSVRWEVAIATPRGTNEVERLADLIGPAARVGSTLCMRAFQSAVGCADAERGTLAWSRNVGGNDPVAADEQYVFAADASDRMTAWRLANGDVAWSNERFLYRRLAGPLALGKAVAYGDGEGYVHFLSRETGETLLRLPTDGSPIVAKPALAGTTMLVVTQKGGVYAVRPE